MHTLSKGTQHAQVALLITFMLVVSKQVMHLIRCFGTVSLAAAACSMDVLRVCGRYLPCFFVICMHSGHVDGTYIALDLLLEEYKSL